MKYLQITLLVISFCHFIYSFICFHSFFYLFILFGGDVNITSNCKKLTQLNHNARNFLRHKWNLNNSQCFRTYCLKIIDKKNTLPHSKVLICHERNFYQEVALRFDDEVWSYFPFLQITFKISFLYVNVCIHWLAMLMRSSKNTWWSIFLLQVSTFYHISTIPQARRLQQSIET